MKLKIDNNLIEVARAAKMNEAEAAEKLADILSKSGLLYDADELRLGESLEKNFRDDALVSKVCTLLHSFVGAVVYDWLFEKFLAITVIGDGLCPVDGGELIPLGEAAYDKFDNFVGYLYWCHDCGEYVVLDRDDKVVLHKASLDEIFEVIDTNPFEND